MNNTDNIKFYRQAYLLPFAQPAIISRILRTTIVFIKS